MPLKLIAIFLLLTFSLAARADQRQHGNIIFTVPEGWQLGRNSAGIQILLPKAANDDCDTCRMHLARGASRDGSLEAFLAESMALVLDEDDEKKLKTLAIPGGKGSVAGRAVYHPTWRVGKRIYIGTLFDLPNRRDLVLFSTRDTSKEGQAKALQVFDSFTKRVAFVSEGAQPLMPQAEAGRLSGVYRGYKMGISVGALGGTLAPSYKTIVFWPDGHFYDGTPPNGLAPLDPAALMTAGDQRFGVYRHERREVVLTYANGRTERMTPLSGRKDGWDFDGRELTKADVLRKGSTLSGRISRFTFGGMSLGSGVSGGSVGHFEITFRPDGTYRLGTLVATGGGFDTGGGFAGQSGSGSEGHYDIRDGMVWFQATAGTAPEPRLVITHAGQTLVGGLALE